MMTAQPPKSSSASSSARRVSDVEVVGRFVEQQQVAAALKQLRQVHAVAFAAGEVGDALLLVRAAKLKRPQ